MLNLPSTLTLHMSGPQRTSSCVMSGETAAQLTTASAPFRLRVNWSAFLMSHSSNIATPLPPVRGTPAS